MGEPGIWIAGRGTGRSRLDFHDHQRALPMIHTVDSIALLHQIAGMEAPANPLVSVIDFSKVDLANVPKEASFACGFYSINFKRDCRLRYGRQSFDHQDGTLLCTGPGQVLSYTPPESGAASAGWGLFFHSDFLATSELASLVHQCTFFQYSENEALHLCEADRFTLDALVRNIDQECRSNDPYAPQILASNLSLVVNYCRRAYGAQIATRNRHQDLLARFERHLHEAMAPAKRPTLPSVRECAEAMGLSTNYFSDLIRLETGRTPQGHIHHVLLERAKVLLATTSRTIAEIAYDLGFEYPQSFSKLFKKKTGLSPLAYRDGFRSQATP